MTTIGVAIAIPEPWGSRLRQFRLSIGDTGALGIPTHITLVPPVEVDDVDVPLVDDHLAEVAGATPSFEVHLRGTGTFRPISPVVFVALAEGISACEQLAAAVRTGPMAVELRFPYHPHVTVAQEVADEQLDRAFEELAGFECRFRVTHFHLYIHDVASGWAPTNRYRLLTGDQG